LHATTYKLLYVILDMLDRVYVTSNPRPLQTEVRSCEMDNESFTARG
jgi:hypothetical protein